MSRSGGSCVCIHRALYDLNRLFSRAVLEGHVRPYLNALLRPSLAVLEGHFRREATARIHVRSLPLATLGLKEIEGRFNPPGGAERAHGAREERLRGDGDGLAQLRQEHADWGTKDRP